MQTKVVSMSLTPSVSAIRDLGELPYEGMDGSACQAVAGRLNMSHAAVRSIWRKEQPRLRRLRENGLLPPAKKQTRRRGSTTNSPKNTGGFSA